MIENYATASFVSKHVIFLQVKFILQEYAFKIPNSNTYE